MIMLIESLLCYEELEILGRILRKVLLGLNQ